MNKQLFWVVSALLFAGIASSVAQSRDDLLRATSQARLESQMGPGSGPVLQPDMRTYERRQEEMALERSRKLRSIMKDATSGLSKPESSDSRRRKYPVSTGITDGTWQAQRLQKMRQGTTYEPVRERRGLLESIGAGMDSVMTNDSYIERRRAGLIDEDAGPLQRLSNAATNMGGESRGVASNVTQGVASVAGRVLPGGDSRSAEEPMAQANPSLNQYLVQPNNPVAPVENRSVGSDSTKDEPGRFSRLMDGVRRDKDAPSELDQPVQRETEEDILIGSPSKERSFSLPSLPSFSGRGQGDSEVGQVDMIREPAGDAGGIKRFRSSEKSEVANLPLSSDPSKYVVSSSGNAEFHPFGNALASGHTPVPNGLVLTMDKAGDEWSAVQLPNGKKGLMKTSDLRRARQNEVGQSSFTPNPRTPPSLDVSGGNSSGGILSGLRGGQSQPARNRYQAPTDVELPKLPRRPNNSDLPLGHGLLPPVPTD